MSRTIIAAAAERLLGGAVVASAPLAGGDLSSVFRLTFADGRSIVAKPGSGALREAEILRAIAATGAPAPTVLAVEEGLLLIEALPSGGSLADAWEDLARVLGTLHAATADRYGWHADHAFGPVAILNGWHDDWPGFWADRRLRCHLPHLPAGLARRIERLADGLAERLPAHPAPALLHGDLWGGNILVAGGRIAGLIDPACYFGDREVDAAMLTLFDHPPPRFLDALGLEGGWRERQPVYRLWPLLAHLRLFGAGYAAAVDADLSALGC
jgi:fructosamine-3-kinase